MRDLEEMVDIEPETDQRRDAVAIRDAVGIGNNCGHRRCPLQWRDAVAT